MSSVTAYGHVVPKLRGGLTLALLYKVFHSLLCHLGCWPLSVLGPSPGSAQEPAKAGQGVDHQVSSGSLAPSGCPWGLCPQVLRWGLPAGTPHSGDLRVRFHSQPCLQLWGLLPAAPPRAQPPPACPRSPPWIMLMPPVVTRCPRQNLGTQVHAPEDVPHKGLL